MPRFVNRARMNTATTGNGAVTLGSATAGFQTFAAAGVIDGDLLRYVIEDGTAWEIGLGVYTAAGTLLSRGLTSSSTGALIVLTGEAVVFVTAAAEDIQPTGGMAILAFGAAPGNSDASVAVTGQAEIVAGSRIKVWFQGDVTSDFNADEHAQVLPSLVSLAAGSIIIGVGFTIFATSETRLSGDVACRWERS